MENSNITPRLYSRTTTISSRLPCCHRVTSLFDRPIRLQSQLHGNAMPVWPIRVNGLCGSLGHLGKGYHIPWYVARESHVRICGDLVRKPIPSPLFVASRILNMRKLLCTNLHFSNPPFLQETPNSVIFSSPVTPIKACDVSNAECLKKD